MTTLHMPSAPGRGRVVSINGAPFDGHPVPQMLESLARIGATHLEPAFIVGYTEPFDESSFTEARSIEYARWLGDKATETKTEVVPLAGLGTGHAEGVKTEWAKEFWQAPADLPSA